LKSDPSVDLVHFTILRPPEKDDMTPLRELALIVFPIQELFEVKLKDFNLIVFDRYVVRDVLPPSYLRNIENYVREGGALMLAVGPEFAGLRSLFPILVPEPLWERINAVDSNGYVLSTLIGPPVAAFLVQLIGGPITLIAVGVLLAIAATVLIGTKEPATDVVTSGRLLRDALDGLLYTVRNRTILGLGLTMTSLNVGFGVLTIAIPVIVLDRLHESEANVGIAWAVSGAVGIVAALYFGRLDSRGREKGWLTWSTIACGAAIAILLVDLSLPALFLAMAIAGLTNGPLDIALFTLRQRRTDPAWMGRAFAVSASINFAGFPIGSAIAGALVVSSLEGAIVLAVAACLLAGFFAWWQIPRDAPDPAAAPAVAEV